MGTKEGKHLNIYFIIIYLYSYIDSYFVQLKRIQHFQIYIYIWSAYTFGFEIHKHNSNEGFQNSLAQLSRDGAAITVVGRAEYSE